MHTCVITYFHQKCVKYMDEFRDNDALVMLCSPSQEYGVDFPFIQVFLGVSWQHFKVFFIQILIFFSCDDK